MEELMKLDIYELLSISITAEEKDIKSAYRKKALSCHPDKNPDNPKAAELFQQLSKALEVLCDKSARAAYDKVLKARKASQVRHRELDSKRKKLKEDLEAREKAAQEYDDLQSEEKLQREIDRLRREGSRLVEEENDLLRQQILKEKLGLIEAVITDPPRLKVKWKSSKTDETNGGYSYEILREMFKKYGNVTCCISTKKNGSAILEFTSPEAAQRAFESEAGHAENPLTISWICGQPQLPNNSRLRNPTVVKGPAPQPEKDSPITSRDYESLVLMRLRQAEERKKLIEKMMEDEN